MRIAVLGNGTIGATVGTALQRAGHEVRHGTRAAGSVAAALDGADVVVLAVPGAAVAGIAADYADALSGRLVIDATNNLAAKHRHARDAVLSAAPQARYARAFNSLGVENFTEPRFGGDTASLLYSSDDADRAIVDELIRGVGLDPVWLGPNTEDILDGLLPVWFALSRHYGRHVAFRVLRDA